LIDKIAGITLTAPGSMPACAHPGDLVTTRQMPDARCKIEACVFQVSKQRAAIATEMVVEADELPLDQQS
jgi:DNA-binding sugar fermentation-stimulating protein